jgi:hypothetical protein
MRWTRIERGYPSLSQYRTERAPGTASRIARSIPPNPEQRDITLKVGSTLLPPITCGLR